MQLLLKKVFIADSNSPHNGLVADILIENGTITNINSDIESSNSTTVFNEENIIATVGWVDIFANFCDPGFEYKETLETGALAAANGGYTTVFCLPNTSPTISTKSQVEYIVNKSQHLPITILPLGAITKNVEGKELAEMYDMYNSGAVAFSDGLNTVQNSGLFLKALQYVKSFNGVVVQLPIDKSIGASGLINEGIISTQLGLPGIPYLAEELIIKRDLDLLEYTNSKLHITGISTKNSVQLIKQAKQKGLNITCSVTPYHLFFCDEDLVEYDSNLKVNPPLRTKDDMLALRLALIDGTIDCIASHHLPQSWDDKTCEFEYAKNGMIGLQTAFACIQTAVPSLTTNNIENLFCKNAVQIFNLPKHTIQIGNQACITLFSQQGCTEINVSNNKSKSTNTPFINKQLQGKVWGTINKANFILNK